MDRSCMRDPVRYSKVLPFMHRVCADHAKDSEPQNTVHDMSRTVYLHDLFEHGLPQQSSAEPESLRIGMS